MGVLFGPDGNGDGNFDLYVSNTELPGGGGWGKNATVKRYDGVTGAFIDTFVTAGSGGLDDVQLLTFAETDSVTLAYRGGENLAAASLPAAPISQTLPAEMTRQLPTETVRRWHAAGADTASLDNLQIQITNKGFFHLCQPAPRHERFRTVGRFSHTSRWGSGLSQSTLLVLLDP